ncbi:MAG: serine hydrolase, partial [Limnochordia bacterium]
MLGRGRNLIIALILALCFASVGVGAMEFDIPADSAILVDWETGQVLFAKNEKERMPAASLTKIMTMLLVMEAVERGQAS